MFTSLCLRNHLEYHPDILPTDLIDTEHCFQAWKVRAQELREQEGPILPPSLISPVVSVDVKHHERKKDYLDRSTGAV